MKAAEDDAATPSDEGDEKVRVDGLLLSRGGGAR